MDNYCKGVQGFINYTTSNPSNISGDGIRYPCNRCKNKKFLNLDIVTMHLLHKRSIEEYLCRNAHREPFVPHETMVERMVGSTFSLNNMHEVVNNNSNPYRTMVMDAMRMNQSHADQCSIIDEEPNADVTRFLIFLKILMNHYGMTAQIIVNYRSLHMCLPSSQNMDWMRSVMTKLSNGRKAFYLKGTS